MPMYKTTFKAIGSGMFPLDMLRYDECHPLDEGALLVTDEDPTGRHGLPEGDSRVIYLGKYHSAKTNQHLTPERWQSFGWRIELGASRRAGAVRGFPDMRCGTEKVL